METSVVPANHEKILRTLGWTMTIFEPSMFELWGDDQGGHLTSKLRAHRGELDEDLSELFPDERVNDLKNAIDSFLKVNSKIQKMVGFQKNLVHYILLDNKKTKKAKKIFEAVKDLLIHGEKKTLS